MTPPQPARAWPSEPTLLVLVLAVLGAHLVVLSGGLPSVSAHTPTAAAPHLSTTDAASFQTTTPGATPPRPAAVLTSQVRWIAPPVAPPPASSPPQPPVVQAVTPPTKPALAPRPPPAPVPTLSPPPVAAASVATAPLPGPESLPETPAIEQPPIAFADPVAAPAQAPDTNPEPASEPPPTANTDTTLAQATAQRDPTLSTSETGPAGSPPGPAQPPASAQLRYSVEGQSKGLTYNATGSLDWRNEGGNYTARMEIRAFLLGSRVQTSQGQLGATGLQPERFGDKSRSERAAHFDHSQNRIRFSNNAPDAELLPGAQDRLSVFLQLAGLLNARPEAFGAGQSVDIPVAGNSGSEIWRFQMRDLTSLNLPAGSLIARHLVREPRAPRDTRVDIWLAPSLGHLPVRIRLTQENGDVVDQRLTSLP